MQKIFYALLISLFDFYLNAMNGTTIESHASEEIARIVKILIVELPSLRTLNKGEPRDTIEEVREEYIKKFNCLPEKERKEYIHRGAIFNRTETGLIHSAFSRLSPKELDRYFRKINFPDGIQ